MKTIKLFNGKEVLVDEEDYRYLCKYTWSYQKTKSGKEYARREKEIKGKRTVFLMHREILSVKKGQEIDHINGNGLDNRKNNLRLCIHQQNMMNRKLHKNNTSGYKGVWKVKRKDKEKWIAEIWVNTQKINLGAFFDIRQAAEKYNEAANLYFGKFANLNII